ncbi:hypothetical protein BGZ83_008352 [Gryganskiella cystojenkinii]|nr:hypothetical protein BGZ83_008352 [Gryganskiella cystojenkinii]
MSNKPDRRSSDEDVAFPVPIDVHLGERLQDHESDNATRIADELERTIINRDKDRKVCPVYRRDVHGKSTGVLKAKFTVHTDIPPQFAKVPGRVYDALVRLSNAAADPDLSDDSNDHRGIAIKLMGVEGPKILETDKEAMTQDFLMISLPFFLTNDSHAYATMSARLNSWNPLVRAAAPLCLGARGLLNGISLSLGKIVNPLQIQYYSAVPYALGTGRDRQAVKYSMKPVSPLRDVIPLHPERDYLHTAVASTLSKGAVQYSFMIQPKSGLMDVEDSMTGWSEKESPFQEVATVTFPPQAVDSEGVDNEELNELGERLSFNPWHSLVEHRPLGSINRVRKIVYERISRVRDNLNGVLREEPRSAVGE